MARRIVVLDEQEYDSREIQGAQAVIDAVYFKITLLKQFDGVNHKLVAVAPIEFSVEQIKDIFGEAYADCAQ